MLRFALSCLLATTTLPADAHSFGRMYNLPVPVWLYLYGAAAALALSFAVIGWFFSNAEADAEPRCHRVPVDANSTSARFLIIGSRTLSVFLLLLCVVAGFVGTQDDYYNINMTLFWIVFVLGLTYLTVLTADIYAIASPWVALAAGVSRFWNGYNHGRLTYPARLGHWPAVLFYMGFIWIELMGGTGPRGLSWLLIGYTAVNLFGIWLIGAQAWFRYCEFFAVFFRLVGKMSPLQIVRDPAGGGNSKAAYQLQWPFMGLMQGRVGSFALLVFILFMLSSTAFDGLRETIAWKKLFWVELYQAGLKDLSSPNPLAAFPQMNRWYGIWQNFWLLASPFVYLAVYLFFIWLTRLVAGSQHSIRELAFRFGYSLLPIALVYNVTHYYTLIQIQGVKILPLASDPFGRGWDLLGTADMLRMTIIPDAEQVWHVQVGLIVFGHIVSVYIAHREALRTFSTHKQAILSQIPMLLLMVILTTVGLWILSEPIQPGT